MARSSSPGSERDHRSLRFQIHEDDDVIEIEAGVTSDYGAGVANFLNANDDGSTPVQFSPGPGKGRGSVALVHRATDDPNTETQNDVKSPLRLRMTKRHQKPLLQRVLARLQERVGVPGQSLSLRHKPVSPALTTALLLR